MFTPARGWAEYHPQKGMVLVATINGPLKLSHEQLMSLSLRDLQKIVGVTFGPGLLANPCVGYCLTCQKLDSCPKSP